METRLVSMRLPVELLDQIKGNRTEFVRAALEEKLSGTRLDARAPSGPTGKISEPQRLATAREVLREPQARPHSNVKDWGPGQMGGTLPEPRKSCRVTGCDFTHPTRDRCFYHPGTKLQ